MQTYVIGIEYRWRVEFHESSDVRNATANATDLVRITYVDEPDDSDWAGWTTGETWDEGNGLYGWTALARREQRSIEVNVVGVSMLSASYMVSGPLFTLKKAVVADYADGQSTDTWTDLRASYLFSVEMQRAFAAEWRWYFNHYGSSVKASLDTTDARTHNWFSNTLVLPGATDGTTTMTRNEDRDNGPATSLRRKYRALVWTAPVDDSVHQYEDD